MAAENIGVWNPSFDVAPGALIEGIITEKGCIPKADGSFRVREFMQQHGLLPAGQQGDSAAVQRSGTKVLTEESVKQYVASVPTLVQKVGPSETMAEWKVQEVSLKTYHTTSAAFSITHFV